MNVFTDHCRRSLESIREQGRYRTFTALQKRADSFPYYLRPDGSRILVWSSNDYIGMGGHPAVVEAAARRPRHGHRCRRHPQHQRHQPGA